MHAEKEFLPVNVDDKVPLSPPPSYHQYVILAFYIVAGTLSCNFIIADKRVGNYEFLGDLAGLMAVLSLYLAHNSCPGIVDPQWESLPGMPAARKKCPTCQNQLPPRASHCAKYNRCVLKFDHYCPFAANAIGYHNYKQYFLLLIYGAYGSGVMLSYAIEPVSEYFWQKISNEINVRLFVGIILMIASLGVFPFCCLLLLAHSFFISKNITTKEFFNFKSTKPLEDLPTPYSQGFFNNIKAVFGEDWTMWWNPFVPAHPRGSGYKFPLSPNHDPTTV